MTYGFGEKQLEQENDCLYQREKETERQSDIETESETKRHREELLV